MAALTSASLGLIVCILLCSSEGQEIIRAVLEQDVILPCKDPNNNIIITAVRWTRPEKENGYVAFYRGGRLDKDSQNPSYQNRVDLQNKEMKDGDASLILKNVTTEDRGIYECRVFQKGSNRRKRSSSMTKTTHIIYLEVHPSAGFKGGLTEDAGETDGGNKDGGDMVGVIVGSVVGVILLLAVLSSAGFLTYRRCMKKNPNLPVPPDEPAAEQML